MRPMHCRLNGGHRLFEPVGAIGDPPREIGDGDGRGQCPPQRQEEIGEQAEHEEDGPKDLALHFWIVEPVSLCCDLPK